MDNFQARKQAIELRRMLQGIRRRLTPQGAVGSIAAPENAGMLTGAGPLMEIFDVLDADGTVTFQLGVTGMTDAVRVE